MDHVRNVLILGRVFFVVAALVVTAVIVFFATKYGGYGGQEPGPGIAFEVTRDSKESNGPRIAFEVTRDSKESNGAGKHTIGYEETVLNDGDGMDAASGRFTVPLAGVYR